MAPKVLIVLTSINKVPGTGEETGWSFVCLRRLFLSLLV